MIHWLIGRLALVAGFQSALIGLVLIVGRLMPMPEYAARYAPDLCAGVPCMLGVVPGRTGWTEAQRLLDAQPGLQIAGRQILIRLAGGGEIGLYPSLDSEAVGRIYVRYPTERPIAAGWVIQRYGQPCGVSFYRRLRADVLTLRYPLMVVNLRLIGERFTPDSPIDTIQFGDPAFVPSYQPDPCIDNISNGVNNTLWRGFFHAERYGES
jgi:hypothetical protein